MTINYTPTSGVGGLGGYAVSITDTAGVPYPTNTTLSMTTGTSSGYYATTYGSPYTPIIQFLGQTACPFSVGQTVYISGTSNYGSYTGNNPFNGNYFKVNSVNGNNFTVLNTVTPFYSGVSSATTSTTLTVSPSGFSAGTFVNDTIFSGSSFATITSTTKVGSSFIIHVASWSNGTPTAGASFSIYPGFSTTGGLATLSYAPQTRTFPVDTSFEPYRREAFRHRSIPAQRNAIQMTNIMGEGTVNTEGLWRREQREWFMGAGQQYLDHKDDDQQARFYSSKGVDVFNYPYQATLLPDTYRVDAASGTPPSNLMTASVNGYMVVGSSTGSAVTLQYFTSISTLGSAWSSATTMTFSGTAPTTLYSMATANTYLYIATNNGIWYATPGYGSSPSVFTLFASGSYTMVAWANEQLIASNGPALYAFQPRSTTTAPLYGSAPSANIASQRITNISNGVGGHGSSGTLVYFAGASTQFVAGQSVNITGAQSQAIFSSISLSGTAVTATLLSGHYSGFSVGDKVTMNMGFSGGNKTEYVVITAVTSTTFSWNTTVVTSTSGFSGGTALSETSLFNGTWSLTAINTTNNYFTITDATGATLDQTVYGTGAIGGYIGGNSNADLLYTHEDPTWVWSDAIGGETQVYFSGYTNHSGTKGNGCIYRSGLLGSSTTSPTNTATVSTATVAQPFQLVSPVQALPMSPDEYPTCIKSYLNFIFIGTNRGIRMSQTLSIYDPTATATGDLKSGPLIPNILQPVTNPVTAIIGDGRFIWFAWNNYDYSSTGLGKLDLSTFIAGDPLAPVYASDLMVTGQGTINSLAWNPVLNIPVIAVGGLGVYQPYATNTNGIIAATQYVTSGTLVTSIFDYGIPDQKAPVYFEYGGQAQNGASITASVVCEPLEVLTGQTLTVAPFTSPTSLGAAIKEYTLSANPKSSQFQVTMTLSSATKTTANDTSPTMYRWTLKSFPNVVSGTNISVVLQLFSVDVVDGQEVFLDPYDNFYWLESLRQAQNLITYTEGPLSSTVSIVESLDWIPHKRRDNYENGYEGDCVITIKTLGPYSYTPQITN